MKTLEIHWDRHSHDRNPRRRCLGGPALQGGYGFLQPEGGTSQQGNPCETRNRDHATAVPSVGEQPDRWAHYRQ